MKIPLLSVFFPPICPACGTESDDMDHGSLCGECRRKLYFFNDDRRCCGCGGEISGVLDICEQCLAEKQRPWHEAKAVFAYNQFAKELMHRFKSGFHPEFARPFAAMAAETIRKDSSFFHADLIVPIPLNPIRLLKRTYNQSKLVAKIISSETNIRCADIMRRKFSLRKQAKLNRKSRHQGLNNEFYLPNPQLAAGKTILLVDDVLTTGMTLCRAAEKLFDAGAAHIDVLVIARTVSYSAKSLK